MIRPELTMRLTVKTQELSNLSVRLSVCVTAVAIQRPWQYLEPGTGSPGRELSLLNPSLPLPLKFPGLKVHAHACEQYIFRSYNKSKLNTVRFTKIHLHAMLIRKRKQK